jgi:hypothetical protein
MKIGFIFLCEPVLARFEVNYCGICLGAQLETTPAVNPLVAKVSSKNLKQAGY